MSSNVTFRPFTEHLGDTNVNDFIGRPGDIFYDPEVGDLRVSDGTTPGGLLLTGGGGSSAWVRPSDWLPMPIVLETDEKFVGLFAVFDTPENFIAVQFEGNYTVDWGDGNVENFSSGVKAQHSYAWTSIDSATLTTDGYRQVLVTVTPQAGQQLTSMNIGVRHDNIFVANSPSSPWLDLKFSLPNAGSGASIVLSNNGNYDYLCNVQRISILNSGEATDFNNLLYFAVSLRSFELGTNVVTDMNNMFCYCTALTTVPLFDTSNVTDMNNMFSSCYALTTVPLFDTSNVTNMNNMFSYCPTITTVPLFNTSNVTNMSGMFYQCYALTTVPLFDTSNVTNLSNMFDYCPNLQVGALNGTQVNIDYSYCLLGRQAIVNIFNGLATVSGKTINITGNYGVADLTSGDYQIATDKGWTVTH